MLNESMFIQCRRRYLYGRFHTCGLSISEGIVMLVLGHGGCQNQDTLAQRSGIDKYRLARVLRELERRGLVERRLNARNRREKQVDLSETGRTLAQELRTVMDDWNRLLFTGFTEAERKEVRVLFGRMMANISLNDEKLAREMTK